MLKQVQHDDVSWGMDGMKRRFATIAGFVLASIILPMIIGAFDGLGLSRTADGNQTFAFAESYYSEIISEFRQYHERRDEFSARGSNMFGGLVVGRSECQTRLQYNYNTKGMLIAATDEDMLVSAALSSQAANVLMSKFDYPAIKALEELPSIMTGALKGCRYTVVSVICDNWAKSKITWANHQAQAELSKEKREWLRVNERASCKAANKFGAKAIKPIGSPR